MNLNIQDLSKLGQIQSPLSTGNAQTKSNNVFEDIYQSAISMLNETNQLQKNADKISTDFALGKIENVHDVMIAQEKASVALQYTVQMKNSILDAYNEIMRMQV